MNRAVVVAKFLLGGESLVTARLLTRDGPFFVVHKSPVPRETRSTGEHSSAIGFLANELGSTMDNAEMIAKFLLGGEALITAVLLTRDGPFFLVYKSHMACEML